VASRPPAASERGRWARAIAGTIVFLAIAPGVVAGLAPGLIAGWEVAEQLPGAVRTLGAGLAALGALVLLHAFARFAFEGIGTPAPVAPTERLVVGGLYGHVRNPMYVAVLAVIAGQAVFFGSFAVAAYGAAVALAVGSFARHFEEPALRRQFGAEYERYRAAVPAWVPRLRPWRPAVNRSPAAPGCGTDRGPSGSGGRTR